MRTLKLPISSSDQQTFRAWATELRKNRFVTSDDFRWAPWVPVMSCNGSMTIANSSVNVIIGRYRFVGDDEFELKLTVEFTTAGTAASDVYLTSPVTIHTEDVGGTSAVGCEIVDNGTAVTGSARVHSETLIAVRRYDAASWALDTNQRIILRGSLRAF